MGSIPESEDYPGVGNGNPLQYSCLENSMGREAWRATVHGVAKSQTQLSTHGSQRAQAQAIMLTEMSVLLQEIHIQRLFDKDYSLPICFY